MVPMKMIPVCLTQAGLEEAPEGVVQEEAVRVAEVAEVECLKVITLCTKLRNNTPTP